MKGLIIKDLCVIKNQMKTLLLVLAFFVIFSIINEDATFILFLVPFYMIMILITTFNYDEFNKWDSYCNSLPLSRKEIVKSKYILFNATSLIVLIGVVEVLKVGQQIIEANRYTVPNAALWIYGSIFFMYFFTCWPVSLVASWLEKRWEN